jgi:hypothetical protein
LGSDGCPATNEVGEPFATIAVADSSRYLLSPQLAFLRAGQFAAVWFSSDVNVEMFDDRLEARLLHPEWPHFLPNYASPSGDPVTLDVQDRWIVSPALTAIDVPESSERRLALIWYAKESQSGSVKLALFDERLERVSDDSVLDTDRDQGSALQDKVIAITYDRSQHALFAMWSKVQGGKSTIVGRRVNVWPEIEPRNWFDVTSPEDAPAYTPSVAVLPDDQVVVAWKSGSGLSAAIFRPNGERRFTNYACGGEAFDALVPSSGQVFEPTAFRVDQQLVVLGTVRRTTGPDATSLVRRVVMPIEEIFPDCE